MVQAKNSVNTARSKKKFCLSLYFSAANSFLYGNGEKIFQFQAKYSDLKSYPLCFKRL